MNNPLRWLFRRKRNGAPIEQYSIEELHHIKREADYLSATVDSTKGMLNAEDTERLKRFTDFLEHVNRRRKQQ